MPAEHQGFEHDDAVFHLMLGKSTRARAES